MAKSKLVKAIEAGFSAQMLTPSNMRDDAKMKEVAQIAYQLLPLPVRLGFQATVGQDGFDRLVLRLRDAMLSEQVMDVSKITTGKILEIAHSTLPKSVVALLTATNRGDESEETKFLCAASSIEPAPAATVALDEGSALVASQIAAAISARH